MKRFLFIIVLLFSFYVVAQDLSINPEDIRIEQTVENGGGYYLVIRKKADINSVLLSESSEGPTSSESTYSFRSGEYNPINGDEKRILDGKFLESLISRYSLIDSSPEFDAQFSNAFKIFIPYIVKFGYPWTRNGDIQVYDGTYINIKTFSKEYADYSGKFKDNPYILKITNQDINYKNDDEFIKNTQSDFNAISRITSGLSLTSNKTDLVDKIKDILNQKLIFSADNEVVIVLDTTDSMKDDMEVIRNGLVPMLENEYLKRGVKIKIALDLFKDYKEEYLFEEHPFTDNLKEIQKNIQQIEVSGGKEIPEAVHEAIYMGLVKPAWSEDSNKNLLLIGDAPPHQQRRGPITLSMIHSKSSRMQIPVNSILILN